MFGLGGNHSGGASYYDGVTAYTPQDTFANTWAGNTFGGGGGGYDPISSFDLGGYAVNSVDRFADYNLPADNYILLPEVQNDLFGTTTDSFDWMNGVMNTGGDYDPSWFTNNFDTGTDTLTNTNFFENENLTLEEAGILEDITSINQTEQNILEDYGLLTYNDDGSVNFDSNEAIARVQALVEDVAEFSLADRRQIAEEDINKLLDRALNLACNELRYKTEIVKQYGRLPGILCDGNQLVQALLNLLFNAVESIESRGTIT